MVFGLLRKQEFVVHPSHILPLPPARNAFGKIADPRIQGVDHTCPDTCKSDHLRIEIPVALGRPTYIGTVKDVAVILRCMTWSRYPAPMLTLRRSTSPRSYHPHATRHPLVEGNLELAVS